MGWKKVAIQGETSTFSSMNVGSLEGSVGITSQGIILSGSAGAYKHISVTRGSASITGSALSESDSYDGLIFTSSAGTTSYASKTIEMPYDIDYSESPIFYVNYIQTNSNRVPNFLMSYRWYPMGGTLPSPMTYTNVPLTVSQRPIPPGYVNTLQTLRPELTSGIPVPFGADGGSILQIRLIRDANNGTFLFSGDDSSFGGNATVLSFGINYRVGSLGTTSPFSDNSYTVLQTSYMEESEEAYIRNSFYTK